MNNEKCLNELRSSIEIFQRHIDAMKKDFARLCNSTHHCKAHKPNKRRVVVDHEEEEEDDDDHVMDDLIAEIFVFEIGSGSTSNNNVQEITKEDYEIMANGFLIETNGSAEVFNDDVLEDQRRRRSLRSCI